MVNIILAAPIYVYLVKDVSIYLKVIIFQNGPQILIHEFHVTSSPWQRVVVNKINLKANDGLNLDFLAGTDVSIYLKVIIFQNGPQILIHEFHVTSSP